MCVGITLIYYIMTVAVGVLSGELKRYKYEESFDIYSHFTLSYELFKLILGKCENVNETKF